MPLMVLRRRGFRPCWRRVLAGVLLAGDVPTGQRGAVDRQPENRLEGHMPIEVAVVSVVI